MIIVELKGGLGNQMFQYAFGRTLATKNDTQLLLDLEFLLDRTPRKDFVFRNYDLNVFKLKPFKFIEKEEKDQFFKNSKALINRARNRIFSNGKQVQYEKSFSFDKSFLNVKGQIYLQGYWQSPKYFESIESSLREEFQMKFNLSEKGKELVNEIENVDSICLNVRRTDFVNIQSTSQLLGFVGLDFYEKASALMAKKISNPRFYVFSDDISWCRDNFDFLNKFSVNFVDHSFKGNKFSEYLTIMSHCKHFIIPNSTFAWWGAWMSKNDNKIVYCPKKWFSDSIRNYEASSLIPLDWERI